MYINDATINQYEDVDASAISEKIDTLLKNLQPVKEIATPTKSKNVELLETDKASENENNTEENNSETLVNRVKKTINDAFIIRKLDKPLQEDLDLDSKERLYQLFSLRFETLKIMLLQSDDDNYHKQIDRIRSLLKNYYPAEKNISYLIIQYIVLKNYNDDHRIRYIFYIYDNDVVYLLWNSYKYDKNVFDQ